MKSFNFTDSIGDEYIIKLYHNIFVIKNMRLLKEGMYTMNKKSIEEANLYTKARDDLISDEAYQFSVRLVKNKAFY